MSDAEQTPQVEPHTESQLAADTRDLPAVEVGAEFGPRTVHLTRDSLVRYAGASGDFNPIHYRDDAAKQAGMPSVLAHGMLTMGLAIQPVVDWVAAGDPSRVFDYQARFTRPVLVDVETGADVQVSAKVTAIETIEQGVHTGKRAAKVTITATFEGRTVLGKALAQVLL
ncbi:MULTISPECIES: MaoC/PaaZ C-terminal domain-containing protein [unclassified Pseudoclavibacter]|uniref:MaoC/PaaZ C-terminal domain-containing protein n=1 Tax=unclassified Pseudoclavibacter TaxID=2615177 RepID=UPI001301357E|nr:MULTISPECIES: MaoC/PaaZ C-terminal domain-containing protein [unclassified Pseudoclavibacter]KAB1647211.1 acyl dehydratase [Pseudoclavibacter sp. CFCC 14310]KAB1662814.1 acyl dehydratase [Pseudoclavibacter sp. CFCC 13611]